MENNKFEKLLKLQKALKPITKDSTNPFYKSKYFDINSLIAELRPIINEIGLVIMQPLTWIEGKPALNTTIIDAENGNILAENAVILPENSDPQKMGSTITYFRRYALQSLLLLEAEDDDGNYANYQKPAKKEIATPAKPSAIPALSLLRTKLSKEAGNKILNETETLKLLADKSGVILKTLKDLNEQTAKNILELWT